MTDPDSEQGFSEGLNNHVDTACEGNLQLTC